jgi:NADH-quinone oxidoreductase subunit N
MAAVFAGVLIVGAALLAVGLHENAASSQYGVVVNAFTKLLAVVVCAGAVTSVLATAPSLKSEQISTVSEYYYLMLTSLCGALIMIFASDFLTLFIGVEVASLALYCLCGARVTQRAGSEAAMKYFLLGCFSSACLLYGIAMVYGVTGSLSFATMGQGAQAAPMVALAFTLVLIGIAFKLGLAPFHFWVPDVYQGAPTSVTAFMSCVVKVAAMGALIKICAAVFGFSSVWSYGAMWVLSVLAMLMGNLAALQQRSVKRMLAYSSVAQAGYMMIGVVIAGTDGASLSATLYYLISYCAMTIGAFAVLSAVGPDADSIQDLHGLGKRSPFLAVSMTVIFLGLAGLPPGLAGLLGKVYLFQAALSAKFFGLAILGALNSALACAYYFRVPAAIFFQTPSTSDQIRVSFSTVLGVTLCVGAVVLFGVFPDALMTVASGAVASLWAR